MRSIKTEEEEQELVWDEICILDSIESIPEKERNPQNILDLIVNLLGDDNSNT